MRSIDAYMQIRGPSEMKSRSDLHTHVDYRSCEVHRDIFALTPTHPWERLSFYPHRWGKARRYLPQVIILHHVCILFCGAPHFILLARNREVTEKPITRVNKFYFSVYAYNIWTFFSRIIKIPRNNRENNLPYEIDFLRAQHYRNI